MAATDAMPVPKKNTAYRHYFVILDATGTPVANATGVAAEISLDGAVFGAPTNTVVEVGKGWYSIDLTAAEMNADFVGLNIESTEGVPTPIGLYPQETNDIQATAEVVSDKTAYALASTGLDQIAAGTWTTALQNVFLADMADVEDTAPNFSLCNVVLASLNASASASLLTIKKTGGATQLTRPLSTDPAADPIIAVG